MGAAAALSLDPGGEGRAAASLSPFIKRPWHGGCAVRAYSVGDGARGRAIGSLSSLQMKNCSRRWMVGGKLHWSWRVAQGVGDS